MIIFKIFFLSYIIVYQILVICATLETNEMLRLPNDTIPINYDIFLKLNNNAMDFDGIVNIEVFIKNSTKDILLHSRNLTNYKINIINLELSEEIKNISYNYYDKSNLLQIFSKSNNFVFEKDKKFLLTIQYRGIINTEEQGIHKTIYNNTSYIISTLFQATNARNAFPCFDEPQFKAKFNLTLNYPSQFYAVSNMPAIQSNSNNDDMLTKTTKFQQTPIMSTYLLAFVLHNYLNVSLTVNNRTDTVYYQNEEQKLNAKLTIRKTAEIILTLENILDSKYILSKLDHFCRAGNNRDVSMENLGLIIYSGSDILIDGTCSTADILNIILITHEIVHQWFGNLVTLKWWTYLWLNEGFATYYSYLIADKIFPECKIMDFYVMESKSLAYSSIKLRPLSDYYETESDINKLFDDISYGRAGGILMMFHNLLTNDTFNKGIHKYLESFQYNVVDEDDLFKCLEDAAIEDNHKYFNQTGFLTAIMKTWTQNNGFPSLIIHRNYTNSEITIAQTNQENTDNQKWFIPINFATSLNSNFENLEIDFIMPQIKTVTIMPSDFNLTLSPESWLLLNKQYTGFYRINYDTNNWLLIAKQLNKDPLKIHRFNKIQIIRDIKYFLENDSIEMIAILEILSYLKLETSIYPWTEAIELLYNLSIMTENDDLLKYFLKDIATPFFNQIKNTNKELIFDTREWIYDFACYIELEDCVNYKYEEFRKYLRMNNESIDFDSIIFGGCIKNITDNEVLLGLNKSLSYENLKDKFNLLMKPYLCTKNIEYISVILNKSLEVYNEPEDIPQLCKIVNYIFDNNKSARTKIINFIWENFQHFANEINTFYSILKSMEASLSENNSKMVNIMIEKLTLRNNGTIIIENNSDNGLTFTLKILLKQKLQESTVREWLNNYKINSETSNIILN